MQNESKLVRSWGEVSSSEQFQALGPEHQERARELYYQDNVAPRVPQGMEQRAREMFDQDTAASSAMGMQIPDRQGGIEAMDFAKEAGGGALTGTGAMISGTGDLVRPNPQERTPVETPKGEFTPLSARIGSLTDPVTNAIANAIDAPARAVGEWLSGKGKAISDSKTDAAKEALKASTPTGDIDSPSTWSMGEDPSVAGYGLHLANLAGQFGPQAGAMLATKGRSIQTPAMMGIGGLQAGGSAGDEVEQRITETPDADLQASSGLYQKLRQTMPEQEARKSLIETARSAAFDGAAPVGALGGLATQVALGPLQRSIGGSVGRKLAAGTLIEAPFEGLQEVAETTEARRSTNKSIEESRSLTEGTFGDFALGALGGTGFSVAGTAISGKDASSSDAKNKPLPDESSDPFYIPDDTGDTNRAEQYAVDSLSPENAQYQDNRKRPDIQQAGLRMPEDQAVQQQIDISANEDPSRTSYPSKQIGPPMGLEPSEAQQAQNPVAQKSPQERAQYSWDSMNTFERNKAAQDTLGYADADMTEAAAKAWDQLVPQDQQKLTDAAAQYSGQRWDTPNQKISDKDRPVLQNRDRSTGALITQMQGIRNKPDYNRLSISRDFGNGAPVVEPGAEFPAVQLGRTEQTSTSTGRPIEVQYAVIEADQLLPSNDALGNPVKEYQSGVAGKSRAIAGNGRVAGITAAWKAGNANTYKDQMAGDTQHGIDPEVIRAMRQPVLVRIMPLSEVSNNIGDESNVSGQAGLSPTEQANTDMRRIDLAELSLTEDNELSENTVLDFIKGMPKSELGTLLTKSGRPTPAAYARAEAALFQQAYQNEALTENLVDLKGDAKFIMNALMRAAPAMAKLEGAGIYDIRPLVSEAAEVAVNARRQGIKLSEFIKMGDFGRNPQVMPILEMMIESGQRTTAIGDKLINLAQMAYTEANKAGQDMFGEVDKQSPEALMKKAFDGEKANAQEIDGTPEAMGDDGRSRPDASNAEGRAADGEGQSDSGAVQADQPAKPETAEARLKKKAAEKKASTEPTTEKWRKNYLLAKKRATELGLDPKEHGKLPGLVKAIDAAMAEKARPEAPALDLNQQTEESLAEDAERLEQLQKEEATQKAKQKAAESKERERDADKARADEVVDDFQLGQEADDAMSGMGDIFGEDSDTRYSVKPKKDADPKNLYVAHNLSVDNLMYADQLGGLAAPSLAVGNIDTGAFDSFGEITLLADPSMLESSKARTFDADVYTPRHPKAVYDINRKAYDAMADSIKELPGDLRFPDISSLDDSGPNAILYSDAAKLLYLTEQGKAPAAKQKKVEAWLKKAAKLGVNRNELAHDARFQKIALDEMKRVTEELYKADPVIAKRRERFFTEVDENGKEFVPFSRLNSMVNEVVRYQDSGGIDSDQLKTDISKKFRTKKSEEDFKQWVTDKFNSMTDKKRIFKGFTPAGSRKYVDYNLDNIVKEMTRQVQGGEGFNYGIGSIRAMYAAEMKSVDSVKARRDKIISADEFNKIKEETNKKFDDVMVSLAPYYKYDADSFSYVSDASQSIAEGPSGWREAFDLDTDSRKIITDFVDYLKNLPTEYFETKVGRAVDLSEFSYAIVPKGTQREAVNLLKEKGIKVKTYDPGVDGSREAAIRSTNDILFLQKEKDATQKQSATTQKGKAPKVKAQDITDALASTTELAGVKVVQSFEDLPARARKQAEIDGVNPGDINGIYVNGTSYVVADNHATVAEAVRTAVHEEVGHLGIRGLLGDKLTPTMERIYSSMAATASGRKLIKDIRADYGHLRDKEQRQAVAEELIAHLLETGDKPTLVQRFVSKVRALLRAMFPQVKWTDSDVLALGEHSRKWLRTKNGENVPGMRYSLKEDSQQRNSGLFDDNGGYKREARPTQGRLDTDTQQDGSSIDLPDETAFRKHQRRWQDKLNRFTVIREWLADRGVELGENADVYLAEERMHSRFTNKTTDFREGTVKPLVEKIQKAGYTMKDVSQFLHAQHAQERNAQIAKINRNMPDGGSGMSNADARAILASADQKLVRVANELRAITDSTRKVLIDSGLISQDQADAWQKAYQHYVPLKGGPDDKASKAGTGKGLKAEHKAKRALGHDVREEGEWIIENILADHERALLSAEKNTVGKHLLKMAMDIGIDSIMTVGKPEKRGVLRNQVSYEVLYKGRPVGAFDTLEGAKVFKMSAPLTIGKAASPADITIRKTSDPSVVYMASPMPALNEAMVYIKGDIIRVQINDELLARAYGNMGADALGTLLRSAQALNRWFSSVYTGYSPEFLILNVLRDFTTGLANITGEEGALFATKAVKNYFSSFGALLKYAYKGTDNKWIRMYREDGGNTGAAYLSDLERLGTDMQTEYAVYQGVLANLRKGETRVAVRAAMRKAFNATLRHIEALNEAGENSMRLALYRTAVEQGMTRNKAASMAKNTTVNFNRKGELGAQFNALFLFFNATVQGTASVAHAHVKGKHKKQAWALSGAMAALSYSLSLLSAGSDEEEYEKTAEYARERNIVIPLGNGEAVTIPIPYGYGFFFTFGRLMADIQRTGDTDGAAWKLASAFTGEFLPFGGTMAGDEPDMVQAGIYMLPTIAQIPLSVANNRTSFGSPMRPENSNKRFEPDRLKMWRGTEGTWADALAGALESVGADVSPETLKHMSRTFGGGAGTFTGSVVDAIALGAQGAKPEIREIPIVRKFYRVNSVGDARSRFWRYQGETRKATEEFQRVIDSGDRGAVQKFVQSNRELIALGDVAKAFSEAAGATRDRVQEIRLGDLPIVKKREQIKKLEEKEAELYDRFVRIFKDKKG